MNKRIKQLKKMLRLEINLPVYLIIFLLVIVIVAYIYIINLNIGLGDKVENLSSSNQQLESDLSEMNKLKVANNKLNKKVTNLTNSVKKKKNKIKNLENELVKVKAELALQDSSDDSIRSKIKTCAESYGVDPYLAIAISRHETGNWTSDLCVKNNNFGGMRGSDDWYSYDTIDLGIDAFCKMLKGYKDNGMGTINTMANTYCGDNSSHWINSVEYFYEQEKYGN